MQHLSTTCEMQELKDPRITRERKDNESESHAVKVKRCEMNINRRRRALRNSKTNCRT